jgi:hypothetical protein
MIAAVSEERIVLERSALTGTWINTNAASRGVLRLDIAVDEDALRVTAGSWGNAPAHAYAVDGFDSREALAFNCTFTLADRDIRLQANIKAGVLVIAFLTRFRDNSGRSNYFVREFYYRSAR